GLRSGPSGRPGGGLPQGVQAGTGGYGKGVLRVTPRRVTGRRATSPPVSDRSVLRQALAVREFRGIVVAQVASETGDQVARLALALVVLERTGSAFGAAATFAVAFVPAFFGAALLGPLADRLSRRTLMLGADLGRAVIIGVLALLATADASLP